MIGGEAVRDGTTGAVGVSGIVTPLLTHAVQLRSVQHPCCPVLPLITQIFPAEHTRPLEQHSPPTSAQPPRLQHFLPAAQ